MQFWKKEISAEKLLILHSKYYFKRYWCISMEYVLKCWLQICNEMKRQLMLTEIHQVQFFNCSTCIGIGTSYIYMQFLAFNKNWRKSLMKYFNCHILTVFWRITFFVFYCKCYILGWSSRTLPRKDSHGPVQFQPLRRLHVHHAWKWDHRDPECHPLPRVYGSKISKKFGQTHKDTIQTECHDTMLPWRPM